MNDARERFEEATGGIVSVTLDAIRALFGQVDALAERLAAAEKRLPAPKPADVETRGDIRARLEDAFSAALDAYWPADGTTEVAQHRAVCQAMFDRLRDALREDELAPPAPEEPRWTAGEILAALRGDADEPTDV